MSYLGVKSRGLKSAALAASLIVMAPAPGAAAAITVSTRTNLGFGQIVASGVAGTVIVTPTGGRSSTGGVVLGNGFGVSVASFTVTGDADATYNITLPNSCELAGATATMTADSFTLGPAGVGNLGITGEQTVTVGATLHVAAGQAAVAYSGSFSFTVSYE